MGEVKEQDQDNRTFDEVKDKRGYVPFASPRAQPNLHGQRIRRWPIKKWSRWGFADAR
jgi:hypothetical protein